MSKIAISGAATGTATFTIESPATSTNRTLTLPDNTGTIITTGSTFAGTGPAFSAYQSSAQTLSSSTTTKLQFQTEEFDTASCFDNSTNYRFTPNVAGYYQANGGLQMGSSATVIVLYLYKNGSNFKQFFSSNSSNVSGGYGSALVYLNGTTDYIELYANITTGQALNATAANVYFQAAMVRAA
jgi:hypothetical protein